MHGPAGQGSGAQGVPQPGPHAGQGVRLTATLNREPPPAPPALPPPLCSASHTHGLSTGGTLCHHSPPVLPSPRQHTSSSVGTATGWHWPWDSHR